MSGVYGTFVEAFPELQELFQVWTKEDKSDIRDIVAICMPEGGDEIKRRKYTSGNTGLDIVENDKFYVRTVFDNLVHVGDYVRKPNNDYTYRLTGRLPYDRAAGYRIYDIERVTGTTPDKNEPLKVKEARFD